MKSISDDSIVFVPLRIKHIHYLKNLILGCIRFGSSDRTLTFLNKRLTRILAHLDEI